MIYLESFLRLCLSDEYISWTYFLSFVGVMVIVLISLFIDITRGTEEDV